jgi:hypothetical protein
MDQRIELAWDLFCDLIADVPDFVTQAASVQSVLANQAAKTAVVATDAFLATLRATSNA